MHAVLETGPRGGRRRLLAFTGRPWRSMAYVVARVPLPGLAVLALAVPTAAGAWMALATVGIPLTLGCLALGVMAAPVERRAVALLGRRAVANPHRAPDRRAPLARLGFRLREASTWREVVNAALSVVLVPLDLLVLLGWGVGSVALLLAPLLVAEGPVSMGPWTIHTALAAWLGTAAGVLLFVAGAYLITGLAAAHAAHVEALLGPRGDELRHQVTELTRSRLRLIDAFDVERRRIERDLHDGAQQQLIALALTLDLARIELEDSDGEAAALVDRAHSQATHAISQLRALVHGIHPPILNDRGLAAALPDLVDRCPVPVRTRIDIPRRLPAAVETGAWFIVSEALANAIKHGRAGAAELDAQLTGARLSLEIRDDGVGGADPARGSGLAGLGDRAAALGGRLVLSSPPGGPTVVRAELPVEALA